MVAAAVGVAGASGCAVPGATLAIAGPVSLATAGPSPISPDATRGRTRVGYVRFRRAVDDGRGPTIQRVVMGESVVPELVVDQRLRRACGAYTKRVEARINDSPWSELEVGYVRQGWCGESPRVSMAFEPGTVSQLGRLIPTRATEAPFGPRGQVVFAVELLPHMRAGHNQLDVRVSTQCTDGRSSPPIASAKGRVEIVVPSAAALGNYRRLVAPRIDESRHPRARSLVARFREELGQFGVGLAPIIPITHWVYPDGRKGAHTRIAQFVVPTPTRAGRCVAKVWTMKETRRGPFVEARSFERGPSAEDVYPLPSTACQSPSPLH